MLAVTTGLCAFNHNILNDEWPVRKYFAESSFPKTKYPYASDHKLVRFIYIVSNMGQRGEWTKPYESTENNSGQQSREQVKVTLDGLVHDKSVEP